MKRLIKKASISLEHATSFESFISICKDGLISPFSMVNKSSKSYSNSQDIDSVYLSKDSGWEFAEEMLESDKYLSSVSLKISVDEGSLLPAYENIFEYGVFDTDIDEETGEEYFYHRNEKIYKSDLTWKDTLEISEECRYNGQIPISSIDSVKFFSDNNEFESIIPNNEVSIKEAQEIVNLILSKLNE